MNTFSKLYDTELHNQEIKSNKRTLMGFCWFFLTLLLVWVLTMINFFLISKFLISLSLGFTVLLLIPPVIIYKKADLSSPWIKYLFLALIVSSARSLPHCLPIMQFWFSLCHCYLRSSTGNVRRSGFPLFLTRLPCLSVPMWDFITDCVTWICS